jgi:hypothetical protein
MIGTFGRVENASDQRQSMLKIAFKCADAERMRLHRTTLIDTQL